MNKLNDDRFSVPIRWTLKMKSDFEKLLKRREIQLKKTVRTMKVKMEPRWIRNNECRHQLEGIKSHHMEKFVVK